MSNPCSLLNSAYISMFTDNMLQSKNVFFGLPRPSVPTAVTEWANPHGPFADLTNAQKAVSPAKPNEKP